MTRPLHAALLATLSGLCAGCPDNIGQLCPEGSKSAGSYTLSLAFQPGSPDECRVTSAADGGPLDASLATAPSPRDSALCVSSDGGVVTLYLAVQESPSNQVSSSPLGDGGTFAFNSSATVSTSACGCGLVVNENISGQVLPAGDGGVTYSPDAGLSPLRGYSGTVTDSVDGGPGCRCPMPCTLRYAMTGTRQ